MPIELQIIRAHEFIRLSAGGSFDLPASKAVLAELAHACHQRGIKHALLDVRDVCVGPKPIFTPEDLLAMINTFHEIGFTYEHRLAVLYSSDPHRRARLFALISTLRGWAVRAFDNHAEAFVWLALDDQRTKPDEDAELTPGAKEIPLRQIKAAKGPMRAGPTSGIGIRPRRNL